MAASPPARPWKVAASPPARPWKGKPATRHDYIGEIKALDAAHFCAAGAVLWQLASDGPRVLMAVEDRKGSGSNQLLIRYNFLGGKRDSVTETPPAVAATPRLGRRQRLELR